MPKNLTKYALSALAFHSMSLSVLASEPIKINVTPYQKSAAVVGQVKATKNCNQTADGRHPEVWLSQGQTLLYQVEVPVNGNYEFHVLPGKYDLLVTNSGGCSGEAEFNVKPKQVANVNLKLVSGRGPASSGMGHLARQVSCGSACFSQLYGYCPTCGGAQNYAAPNVMPWGIPAPDYWQSGPVMFNNFYAPAPWSYAPANPGVAHGYFPGQGNMYAAKPNLYIMGKPGTNVSVKLKFPESRTNWLVAVPTHGTEGWRATLANDDEVSVNGVTYGYLYSDYRAFDNSLQDEEGFCAPKDSILRRMAVEMQGARFTAREIGDFLEYWTVKLPQSESYCVYPQDERQLDKMAALDITPKPTAVRRLLFLVQVKEGLKKDGGKFTKAPARSWSPTPLRSPAAADSNAVIVHEWGVGFLAAKP